MRLKILLCILCVWILLLTGCSMTTVDEMYQLPKRSEDYNDLQSAIDSAMVDLSYSAPLTGENQQNVQMADLDGDGNPEYLLFAKSTQEKPMRILVFQELDGTFVNVDTVECNGSAFDQVEYVDMDGKGGAEVDWCSWPLSIIPNSLPQISTATAQPNCSFCAQVLPKQTTVLLSFTL